MFADADFSPSDIKRPGPFPNSVNLQANVAFGVSLVDFGVRQICDKLPIDPRLESRPLRHDAELVPFSIF